MSVGFLEKPRTNPFVRVYGAPEQPKSVTPPERAPEPTLDEARAALARLKEAAAPIAAKAKAKPDRFRPTETIGGDAANRFLEGQATDAVEAVTEALAGDTLTCLSWRDVGRSYRALLGGPPAPERTMLGAIEVLATTVAKLEAEKQASDYEPVTHKLRAADLEIAKSLLAFRDAWAARVELAQSAPRPAHTVTRPALRVTANLAALFLAIRGAKAPEDLL